MKNNTLGKNLLIVYGALIVFNFFRSNFSLEYAVGNSSWPTNYLIPQLLGSVGVSMALALGFFLTTMLYGVIQGAILYYGGNWLEKVLKKK